MKAIEAELSEIKKKMCSPVAVENLLDDTVLSTAFPTIRRLLRVYVIIPFSEAVVERGFSKWMNLIVTEKRFSLDSIDLDALMQTSFRKKKLENHEIDEVIDIWKIQKTVIFSIDLWLCTETNFSLNVFIEAIWLLLSLQIWYYI